VAHESCTAPSKRNDVCLEIKPFQNWATSVEKSGHTPAPLAGSINGILFLLKFDTIVIDEAAQLGEHDVMLAVVWSIGCCLWIDYLRNLGLQLSDSSR
jgi:hypothetical protein